MCGFLSHNLCNHGKSVVWQSSFTELDQPDRLEVLCYGTIKTPKGSTVHLRATSSLTYLPSRLHHKIKMDPIYFVSALLDLWWTLIRVSWFSIIYFFWSKSENVLPFCNGLPSLTMSANNVTYMPTFQYPINSQQEKINHAFCFLIQFSVSLWK